MRLDKLRERMDDFANEDEPERAHRFMMASDISRFMERPAETIAPVYNQVAPPGAPIGDTGMDWLSPVVWDCVLYGEDAAPVWPLMP